MGRDRHILRDFCAYACVIAVLNFGCLVANSRRLSLVRSMLVANISERV